MADHVAIVELCSVVGAKVREAAQAPALVFTSGSSELTAESQTAVAEIAMLVEQCPGTKLNVVGQTDTRGSEVGNEALALQRAQAVADALAAAGVPADDMTVQGNAANALSATTTASTAAWTWRSSRPGSALGRGWLAPGLRAQHWSPAFE